MSDQRNTRVDNVRLVRLPDGRLVTEKEARASKPSATSNQQSPNIQTSQNTSTKTSKPSKNKLSLKQKTQRLALKRKLRKQAKQKNSGEATTSRPIVSTEPRKVQFSLTLPKLKKPKLSKRQLGLAGIAVVLVIGSGAYYLNSDKKTSSTDVLSDNTEKVQEIPVNQSPEFGVLLPVGKTPDSLGGFAKVSPSNSAAAYAFIDKIGQINIKVTQQEIPEAFKANPSAEIEKMAKNFNATKQFQVDGVDIYVGKSERGPQTLLFIKDNLLVFIGAESEVRQESWVPYIAGLKK